ncbi:hypothetical protein [Ruminococcus albus]|uniref:Conserved domain protein n=1 Tax=Ruminococcus albus 8 TaxID=246199 RepID=E9S8E6_RUMAL|nr:hypothetical protein [Ruminococcus albus]EGC04445.1 conserved domain protein [Ruminococcus albus 8]MCC3352371.1 hypothetical protein [Ruminococcus albus 8]
MNEKFSYNYSAGRQAEIDRIREKYQPTPVSAQEEKMARLRRLDSSCESAAQVAGLVLGIVGTLVFGLCMCCFMVWHHYVLGVLLGLVGLPMIAAAKPVYDRVLKTMREKNAPEIIRLTDELKGGA